MSERQPIRGVKFTWQGGPPGTPDVMPVRMCSCGNAVRIPHINWQPIETAPKDRPILLHEPHSATIEGMWRDGRWREIVTGEFVYLKPTHWCELETPGDE